MLKRIFAFTLIAILFASANLNALDPLAMLEDGKRAYDLANWEESLEILQRFMDLWPEHEKFSEALYFHTLASAKSIESRTEAYRISISKDLENAIASLSLELPDMDASEAKVALMIAKSPNKPELWKELTKLTPSELKHYLARGWYPNPTVHPIDTLNWAKYRLANDADIDSETKANIGIIKLSALWKIMLSPLVAESLEEQLKKENAFPLNKVFKETLNEAFKNGNPEQKRKIAIYGYHFDYFYNNNLNTGKKIKSFWLRYLKSRGISTENAWCP